MCSVGPGPAAACCVDSELEEVGAACSTHFGTCTALVPSGLGSVPHVVPLSHASGEHTGGQYVGPIWLMDWPSAE